MKRALLPLVSIVVLSVVGVGCSPPPPPPKPAAQPTATHKSTHSKPLPAMDAEVGSVDPKAADKAYEGMIPKVTKCVDDRRKAVEKLDFLAGEIRLTVVMNRDGSAKDITLPESNLGDVAAEKCIIAAAKAHAWPQVQGGKTGKTSNTLNLPMKAGREPVPWDSAKVQKEIGEASSKISACTSGKGKFTVTAYVDTDGTVISAGATVPTEGADSAAECVAKEIKALKFSSPGGWPAKVTFETPLAISVHAEHLGLGSFRTIYQQ